MGKSTNFIGQPLLNQLLFFVNGVNINKIAKKHNAERYIKKFDTRKHLVVMLFGVFEGHDSIRELVIGMMSNAHKPAHLGVNCMIRRSTLSDANRRRKSVVFGDIYMAVYRQYPESLPDSRLKKLDIKRLFAMDSTTVTLFKDILKGCGRLPGRAKRKAVSRRTR
jgi:hypothetical protein